MTRRRGSIVVRQALVSTFVMLVALALIALSTGAVVERQQRTELLAAIDTDIAGLADGMAAGGPSEVARRIKDRLAFASSADAHYRLSDGRGMEVTGNLGGQPALDAAHSRSGDITTSNGLALARATRLRGGYTLIVARSLAPVKAMTDRLTRLFLLASFPAAALSLVAGGLLARDFGARVSAINATFGRFEGGERSARTGLAGRADELDILTNHVDRHLARTEMLIEAQRDISDNIAHELRTPLGHLDSRLLRALEVSTDPAVTNELLVARADIRAIVSLFDALLDLALAEAGDGSEISATMFDLSERIGDLCELFTGSAEEAGLDFTARVAPAVMMRGEPMAMTRAVANLLDNAFKFAPAGSRIRLTVMPGPRIVVEDDGPGVAPGDRDRMFQRFRGSREAGGGHGLGLALVRVIAARHGLVSTFEDAQPGARFILTPAGLQ